MISVIMPVYNMGNRIRKGLESVLKQTYSKIEIIIVDDGSTDDSYKICQCYAKNDSRIRLFHTKNQGSGEARNYGIAQAEGRYLYFMDADDEIHPNALKILAHYMEKEDVDLVVCGYDCINSKGIKTERKQFRFRKETGEYVRKNYQDFVLMRSTYAIQGVPWNKLFKSSIVKEYNVLYPDLRRQQDEIFIARYVDHIKNVCFIEDILYDYYINDIHAVWEKFPKDYMDISNSLLQYRLDIIQKWNEENSEVRRWLYYSYLEGVIISIDITFNPKSGRTPQEIKQEIRHTLGKLKEIPPNLMHMQLISHRISVLFIRHRMINALYAYTKFKLSIKNIFGK